MAYWSQGAFSLFAFLKDNFPDIALESKGEIHSYKLSPCDGGRPWVFWVAGPWIFGAGRGAEEGHAWLFLAMSWWFTTSECAPVWVSGQFNIEFVTSLSPRHLLLALCRRDNGLPVWSCCWSRFSVHLILDTAPVEQELEMNCGQRCHSFCYLYNSRSPYFSHHFTSWKQC